MKRVLLIAILFQMLTLGFAEKGDAGEKGRVRVSFFAIRPSIPSP